MENSRIQKRSEMFSLVKTYKSQSASLLSFCKERDLRPTTFRYWLNKFNMEQNQASGNGFVELLGVRAKPFNVELCYPNGVVIRVCEGLADAQNLGLLIKLW